MGGDRRPAVSLTHAKPFPTSRVFVGKGVVFGPKLIVKLYAQSKIPVGPAKTLEAPALPLVDFISRIVVWNVLKTKVFEQLRPYFMRLCIERYGAPHS